MAEPAGRGITVEEWRKFVDNMHWMTLCTCCATTFSVTAILWLNRKVRRLEDMYDKLYAPLSAADRRFPETLTSSPDWKNITEQVKAVQFAVWGPNEVNRLHTQIATKHGVQSTF